MEWLTWPRLENRNSGWWDPVVGGSLLVGALGLHLPAAVMGAGRERLLGLGGAAVTLVAIFATGTRGAWIAAAALLGVVVLVAGVRGMRGRAGAAAPRSIARRVGVSVVVGAVLIGAAVWLLGDAVAARYREGRAEVAAAVERGDYSSYTGARLLMWRAAVEAVYARPLIGVGAGGYKTWGREWVARESAEAGRPDGADEHAALIHEHAHSAPLHVAATTGVIGLGLAGLVVFFALYGGFTELGPRGLGSYAAGPGFAIAGMMLVGVFDVVQLNAQTGALVAVLMVMCLLSRPRVAA